jgi:micrococcal nuclease
MLKRIIFFFFLINLFFFPSIADGHTGTRDELGGHFRNKDCVYLLHEPTPLAKQAKTIDDLIGLIQENSSNSCKNTLTADKIDLEGYSLGSETFTKKDTTPSQDIILGKTYAATLESCTDGDTATFNINGSSYKVRFLFIDTPESTIQKEPFGKEASEFTCAFLKQGPISIETDGKSLFDKYDRLLAWVFVGEKLHQEEITMAGLVEDFYDYGNYKYESRVRIAMAEAKTHHRGIYAKSDPNETIPKRNIFLFGLIVLVGLISIAYRYLK